MTRNNTTIPIRLPRSSMKVLERVAVLAGTNVQTVIQVMMALEVLKAIKDVKRKGGKPW